MKKILSLLTVVTLVAAFTSCRSEDDLTDSIFDTTVPAVDTTKATAPFDQWLYDNFVKPYNVEVQYQFNYPASDLSFQLAPADYNRSQLLAQMIRYLFYDVYTKYAGDEFMKLYGPPHLPLHRFLGLQCHHRHRGARHRCRRREDYALQRQRDACLLTRRAV